MQVREIMTANPACATPETSLRDIAQLMVEHDCGCVPIVENQTNKKPIGTITDRDITIRAFATGQNPADMKASDVMTMGVTTITPDANIEKCADVMEDKKIRRVVVTNDDGKVVGMVAQADIAEHAPHPSIIGNVVNEISDAPASPNRGVFNRIRDNRSYSNNQSQPNYRSRSFRGGDYESQTYRSNRSHKKEESSSFGINSLLPLLAGIGISLAAKYYLGSKEQTTRRSLATRPVPNTIPESTHSTEKSVSVDTTIGSTTSNDKARSASASSSIGAAGTSNPFGSESSTGSSSSFDSSSSTGGSGRSDFGNQTSGGSADLSTFGDGDFKSAGDSDLKPILEVGRNPGNV